MPDFDPSHIITIAALMEGGNEVDWQKGEAKLKQLKDSIAAFYSTDAQSQDLMKTGQGPVQVMLSVNAYHLQEQGIAVKVVQLHGSSLVALGVASLPPDVIAEGTIKDPPTVVDAIKEAVARASVNVKEAAIGVSGRELIIKKVQIPEVPARELRDAVQGSEGKAWRWTRFSWSRICRERTGEPGDQSMSTNPKFFS